MSELAFLIDEPVPARFLKGLHLRAPYVSVRQVNDPSMPAKGTLDPDLLIFCETQRLALISNDINTLPDHVNDHLLQGRHTWGVFILRPGFDFDELLDDILLIHCASQLEDWFDQLEYLPL